MEPSGFVVSWIARLERDIPRPRRALDVAMGHGRHARVLLAAGFDTFGVDLRHDRVLAARHAADGAGFRLHGWVADLDRSPLPRESFDLVVCTNYLARRHWNTLLQAPRRGGFLICETFTTAQLELGFGPRSPDHLLRPGELRDAVVGWDVLIYEEVERPVALAHVAARKPGLALTRGQPGCAGG